jgi:hypothetical protein
MQAEAVEQEESVSFKVAKCPVADDFLQVWTFLGHGQPSAGDSCHRPVACFGQRREGQALHLTVQQQFQKLAVRCSLRLFISKTKGWALFDQLGSQNFGWKFISQNCWYISTFPNTYVGEEMGLLWCTQRDCNRAIGCSKCSSQPRRKVSNSRAAIVVFFQGAQVWKT